MIISNFVEGVNFVTKASRSGSYHHLHMSNLCSNLLLIGWADITQYNNITLA